MEKHRFMYVCSYGIYFYNNDDRCNDIVIIVFFWDGTRDDRHVTTASIPFYLTVASWREKRSYTKILSQEEYNEFLSVPSL